MDWQPGEFLDADQRWIVCSIHGATYEPADGRCVGGPCGRARLTPVPVQEHDGQVYWYPSRRHPARALRHSGQRKPAMSSSPDDSTRRRPAAARCRAPARGARAGRSRRWIAMQLLEPAAQRTPLARLLPPGLAGTGAGRGLGPVCRPLRSDRAEHTAHGAGGSARRDRRRQRSQRRGAGLGAEERLRGPGRAGRGAAHQLARRQPGAERHRQRRDPAPEGPAQQEGLRRGRGGLRLRGLLHRRGRRRDLRRQGQHRGQHRRADGRLRLHRVDGQARHRTPAAHRGREQGHARPLQPRRARSRRPTPRP